MQKSFMTQKWSELIMLHWPVPERKVSETTPEDLRPDLYNGQAWASVVVFKLSNLRVFPIRFLKWGSFFEINLRTYVRDEEGRRGVWFYSLDAADFVSVVAARLLYGLSYNLSEIKSRQSGQQVSFDLNRILFGGKSRSHIQASITDQEIPREKGSLDEFLLERYRFWASRNHKKSTTARVKHKPYEPKKVEAAQYRGNLFGSAGLGEPNSEPVLSHYSEGFPVEASAPSWLNIAGQENQT